MKPSTIQQQEEAALQEHAEFGHSFSGCVSKQPLVDGDHLKVCGHTLSPPVARAYRDLAHQKPAKTVHICGQVHGIWTPEFCKLVKKNLKDRLGLSSIKGRDWLLHLPEDVLPKHVKATVVPPTDPRVALRGQLACSATHAIRPGAIIGPYRSLLLWSEDFRRLGNSPPKGWGRRSGFEFRCRLDEYSAEAELSNSAADTEIFENVFQGRALYSSAYMHGNVLALVNDARQDPINNIGCTVPRERYNCELRAIAVGGFPFFFLVATREIKPGEELLYDYEEGYWDRFRQNNDIMTALNHEIELIRASSQVDAGTVRVSASSGEDRVSGIATRRPDVVTVKLDSDGGRDLVSEHPVPPLSPFLAAPASSSQLRGAPDSVSPRAAQAPRACPAPAAGAPDAAEKASSFPVPGLPGWGRKRARVVDAPTLSTRPRSSPACSAEHRAVPHRQSGDVPMQTSPAPLPSHAVREATNVPTPQQPQQLLPTPRSCMMPAGPTDGQLLRLHAYFEHHPPQRLLPPEWHSLDELAQGLGQNKRPRSAAGPCPAPAQQRMHAEGDGQSPPRQASAPAAPAEGPSLSASGRLKRLVKASELTQAQVEHRHSRPSDGATMQPALAHSTSLPVACLPPGRTASLPRATATAVTSPDQLKAGAKPSGSLGLHSPQLLARSPPAKHLPFLRPAHKPSLKGTGSLKASLSAAPLRPLSAGRASAGLGSAPSSSSWQSPPSGEQQPDRPLSASPPQHLKGKTSRANAVARAAQASAVPVGRHRSGADARVNRYLHCATPDERRQMRQSRDSSGQ